MEDPFCDIIKKVRVLLIDQDKECGTDRIVDLLKFHNYKVTTVMAPAAMSMLSKGKKNIDVMIINANSPDSHCFELLEQAVTLDIISLFVCDENNKILAKKALNNGAYLYIKKPLDQGIVKHLRQFVLREKIQREKLIKGLEANGDQMNIDDNDNNNNNNIVIDKQAGEKNIPITTEEQGNNIQKTKKDIASNGTYKLRRKRETNEGESQGSAIIETIRPKIRIKWNDDLHFKFTEAMKQLGEGRCYPADILEVMNVPDLTKNQVSSHLQKCRSNNWRPEKERRFTRRGASSGSQQRNSFNTSLERKKRKSCKNFGRMPSLQTNVTNETPRSPVFIPPVLNTNNIFASSTEQQLHHPQLQVPLSTPNNAGSGIQQQHSLLFGTFSSENPIFVSTNHMSGLAFNSGDHHDYGLDHHTQNDYSLNLNDTHVTTYSGSTMMSDINVGRVINNGLRTINVNIHQHIGEQNMFDPSNIIATSNVNDIEGSESNELDNCDIYFNFNNMDDLLQNLGSPSATLPNEHDNGSNTECPVSKNSKFPDA